MTSFIRGSSRSQRCRTGSAISAAAAIPGRSWADGVPDLPAPRSACAGSRPDGSSPGAGRPAADGPVDRAARRTEERTRTMTLLSESAASGEGHGASTGELVKQLSEQVSRLVRDEMKLASVEMTGKAKTAGKGAGLFGGGGILALYGGGCLVACAVIALAGVLRHPRCLYSRDHGQPR